VNKDTAQNFIKKVRTVILRDNGRKVVMQKSNPKVPKLNRQQLQVCERFGWREVQNANHILADGSDHA